ncbi:rod shape-determining protein MreD [Listeria welshimeri]|uniref:Rod shape-determining protein MreD n=1 Tax=Listeria welshimeri TaxID=1643 RepID=A0A7X0T7W3_LISWE|nr:rod shape-determining protein MreD [Listeria welshimeri]MBC1243550.1 rod shape-determining protein MreD [Listeria welshimeri]MBC1248393.1 rod shape-determining protein MreD [Listeria welshimeri]MBC1252039.1 rod shape-determining protein MreD [Listeria welshimeri]MBC1281573.1 rod shape-determining protein MreD [Listeria welshimeri]MBC1320517.1 rod shape-determining protein MreD [Listeria welshimeri]
MNVKKNIALPAIMVGTFILEGVFSLQFGNGLFNDKHLFIPHFLLVMLTIMTCFYKRNTTLVYAFILGLLFDIYYTGVMGIYFAIFPFTVYITDKFMKVLQNNIFLVGLITIFNVILTESLVYAFYYLIGSTTMSIPVFIDQRLWTTILFNLAFFLVIFFPFRLFLDRLAKSE